MFTPARPAATARCLLALLAACQRQARPHHPDAAQSAPPPPAASPAPHAPAWCFTPLPHADVRAIDPHGAVWSITGSTVTDETHRRSAPLEQEVPCPMPGAFALELAPDGSARALVNSRFHLRSAEHLPFVVTPMCSDIQGAPWSPRRDGGWSFVAHTWRSAGPGLLLTSDRSGASGWYAVTALDPTLTAAVLDPDHSILALANHGHLVFVDQHLHVAGEVLASRSKLYQGLRRTPAGLVAFLDEEPDRRVLVLADTVTTGFASVDSTRSPGVHTHAVFRVDLARLLAVTDRGVELSTDRGQHFTAVLDTPRPLVHPTFGWLPGGHPALASRDGIVTDHCLYTSPPDR